MFVFIFRKKKFTKIIFYFNLIFENVVSFLLTFPLMYFENGNIENLTL